MAKVTMAGRFGAHYDWIVKNGGYATPPVPVLDWLENRIGVCDLPYRTRDLLRIMLCQRYRLQGGYVSQSELGQWMGLGERQVRRHIKLLEKLKLIKVVERIGRVSQIDVTPVLDYVQNLPDVIWKAYATEPAWAMQEPDNFVFEEELPEEAEEELPEMEEAVSAELDWDRVKLALAKRLTDNQFKNWVEPIRAKGWNLTKGILYVGCNDRVVIRQFNRVWQEEAQTILQERWPDCTLVAKHIPRQGDSPFIALATAAVAAFGGV